MEPGTWSASITGRIVNTLAGGAKQIFRPGVIGTGSLNTVEGQPSIDLQLPVTDSLKQLLTATFNLCLVPVGADDPPPVGTATWGAATATNHTAGSVTLSKLIDGTTATGSYNLAYDVVRDGQHETGWAMDRTSKTRRALVVVT